MFIIQFLLSLPLVWKKLNNIVIERPINFNSFLEDFCSQTDRMSERIQWLGNPDWDLCNNKFAFRGRVCAIDDNGFWYLNGVLCWGKPWVERSQGKLHGAPIDPKLKEAIEHLNSPQQMRANLNWLNAVSSDPTVAAFSFPSRAHVIRETKPCKHITWAERAHGCICVLCTTYHIEKAGQPIVLRKE